MYNTSNLSNIELAILRSENPLDLNEAQNEKINFMGEESILMNQHEIRWRGDVPINEYKINNDSNPIVIHKKVKQIVQYVQELAIRYLKPPTPPAPGEIVISMEANIRTGPAPPLIIRQHPTRAATPEPLVIREAPPQPPAQLGTKKITISGKNLPPPPRKLIIERFAPLPNKPQNVIIERWLPYTPQKRKVILNKNDTVSPQIQKTRNLVIQWETPDVNVKQQVKYLGVIRANPVEYVRRYGSTLKQASELPDYVHNIKTPPDVGVLAADKMSSAEHELIGELDMLRYVDLEKEGLGEYTRQLTEKGIIQKKILNSKSAEFKSNLSVVSSIFDQIDKENNGRLSLIEARSIFLRINIRIGKYFDDRETKKFFKSLKRDEGLISVYEFRNAYMRLI